RAWLDFTHAGSSSSNGMAVVELAPPAKFASGDFTIVLRWRKWDSSSGYNLWFGTLGSGGAGYNVNSFNVVLQALGSRLFVRLGDDPNHRRKVLDGELYSEIIAGPGTIVIARSVASNTLKIWLNGRDVTPVDA